MPSDHRRPQPDRPCPGDCMYARTTLPCAEQWTGGRVPGLTEITTSADDSTIATTRPNRQSLRKEAPFAQSNLALGSGRASRWLADQTAPMRRCHRPSTLHPAGEVEYDGDRLQNRRLGAFVSIVGHFFLFGFQGNSLLRSIARCKNTLATVAPAEVKRASSGCPRQPIRTDRHRLTECANGNCHARDGSACDADQRIA